MGMADFYLKINYKKSSVNALDELYQALNRESIFRVLTKDANSCFLSIECKFDNFIPSLIIAFDYLSSFAENIISIETHGSTVIFEFHNIDEFLAFMFSSNKNQLLSYYKHMGYFAIDSEKYYKRRIKLKKYYKKLK